ncbi:MAG: GxxExxY protein [Phycisphaera sp.]|nr:GxxExxY protein [Phycisphaera sp.]
MSQEINSITDAIIGSVIAVHRELGPGLLESTYEVCLAYELAQLGIEVECQKQLPVRYKSITLDTGYRIDLLVSQAVIVEIKSIDGFSPVHTAQLLGYLRLSGLQVGLLLNFNTTNLTHDGLKRVVNNYQSA